MDSKSSTPCSLNIRTTFENSSLTSPQALAGLSRITGRFPPPNSFSPATRGRFFSLDEASGNADLFAPHSTRLPPVSLNTRVFGALRNGSEVLPKPTFFCLLYSIYDPRQTFPYILGNAISVPCRTRPQMTRKVNSHGFRWLGARPPRRGPPTPH